MLHIFFRSWGGSRMPLCHCSIYLNRKGNRHGSFSVANTTAWMAQCCDKQVLAQTKLTLLQSIEWDTHLFLKVQLAMVNTRECSNFGLSNFGNGKFNVNAETIVYLFLIDQLSLHVMNLIIYCKQTQYIKTLSSFAS